MSATAVSFRALGTTATVCADEPVALAPARAAVEAEIEEIDAACSRFRSDSELLRVNASAGSPVPIGVRLVEALQVALRAAELTDGLVDPTIGRTLRLAGYDRPFTLVAQRRGSSFRAAHAPVPGWRLVELDAERATVRVAAGVELDLGATAKALAADRAARAAAAKTGSAVLVSLGGDVAVAGPARPWPILIADDHAATLETRGPVVEIRSGGLATSGTAVRRWRAGRADLHHIVDPATGRPARTPLRTVSVAAASCVDANVAATAAVILGDGAPAWLEARGLPARLVRATGAVACVGGWPEETACTA